MPRTVHVVGAGLSGLAAAVRLAQAGKAVVLHEAAAHPGGRCRSYYDHATGLTIDNGNHLLLSANRAALSYLETIGSSSGLIGPATADFPFVDLAENKRWTLRLGNGRLPFWMFDATRRVPGTELTDYLRLAPLLWRGGDAPLGEVIRCEGTLYERLARPLLLAALNTEPSQGSAALARSIVRETLLAGGAACRPLIARDGLGPVFVDPALAYVQARGGAVRLSHELRALHFVDGRVHGLDFASEQIELRSDDAVVLAVPPYAATKLIPGLQAPSTFRAIVNAHFRFAPAPDLPPITGVLSATTEWVFAFPDRISVTISNADRLLETPRQELAGQLWDEVSLALAITAQLPPWQIVRERRATFAATPEENAKRPESATGWGNLALAGDWTATGLPATIEGAIRSGQRAADLII